MRDRIGAIKLNDAGGHLISIQSAKGLNKNMSDTLTHNERHVAGPIGRVRADLINFFAATAMLGTFALGFPESMWFFFAVAGLTIITVVSYWSIKLWMKYRKNTEIKESEARISAILAALTFLVAITCGVLTFGGEENQATVMAWLVFNVYIACLVLMQIIFLLKREKVKDFLTWLVFIPLSVMCIATVASASLSTASLATAANSVAIAGLACWLALEAIGCVDNLRQKKNTEEYAGIKFYWIKNVLQILAAISFITFLSLLLVNLNDDELNNFSFGNAFTEAPVGTAFFYVACGTTIIGVIAGVYCGFRHFLNKLPASIDINQSQEVRGDEEVDRPPVPATRRRDALKRASREFSTNTPRILSVKE